MSVFDIHPQLLEGCHHLGRFRACEVLLKRNASLPWFILVPDTRLADFLDLPAEHREAVGDDCALISRFLKEVLGFSKVNFAGIGNLVPQMHLHVIGRAPVDPCWPHTVWGNLEASEAYELEQLKEWQSALVRMGSLIPARL